MALVHPGRPLTGLRWARHSEEAPRVCAATAASIALGISGSLIVPGMVGVTARALCTDVRDFTAACRDFAAGGLETARAFLILSDVASQGWATSSARCR